METMKPTKVEVGQRRQWTTTSATKDPFTVAEGDAGLFTCLYDNKGRYMCGRDEIERESIVLGRPSPAQPLSHGERPVPGGLDAWLPKGPFQVGIDPGIDHGSFAFRYGFGAFSTPSPPKVYIDESPRSGVDVKRLIAEGGAVRTPEALQPLATFSLPGSFVPQRIAYHTRTVKP